MNAEEKLYVKECSGPSIQKLIPDIEKDYMDAYSPSFDKIYRPTTFDEWCISKPDDLIFLPSLTQLITAMGERFDGIRPIDNDEKVCLVKNHPRFSGRSCRIACIKALKEIKKKKK